jgi:hypothetical protein
MQFNNIIFASVALLAAAVHGTPMDTVRQSVIVHHLQPR